MSCLFRPRSLLALLYFTAAFGWCHLSLAQGLRVSTHVYDVLAEKAEGRQVALTGSLSLFHHGKVYDYVDAADEVVILDMAGRRFTVLNTARKLTTSLAFEEIQHMLSARIPSTDRYIKEILVSGRPRARQIATLLRFQLQPEFESRVSDDATRLTLSSPSWTYRVRTTPWDDPAMTEQYLAWADWMARLNHVMHPGSLFPEPRLELNTALREVERLPLSVELDLRPNDQLHLRAEHRYTAGLDDDDHRRIARWESLLKGDDVQAISFRSYQQRVLLTSSR